MNRFILTVQGYLLYPEKYTKEQLEQNYIDAATEAARIDANDDDDAYVAAHVAASAAYAARAEAADDAASAAYAAAYVTDCAADDWLDEYFVNTGENRQGYIDAINEGKQ